MRLILTLLCRNEIDIIESMIRFHLAHGVDFIVATDNGSSDGTRNCLQHYVKSSKLLLIDQSESTHDQAVWVTAMARIATEQLGADWLIHSDADEFWWPLDGDLKTTLQAVPPGVQALTVGRTNFLPPPREFRPGELGVGMLPSTSAPAGATLSQQHGPAFTRQNLSSGLGRHQHQ